MTPEQRSNIYTDFVEEMEQGPGGSLSLSDISLLKTKRGLTKQTAITARLITGTKAKVSTAIKTLKGKYSLEDLQQAGLCYKDFPHILWIEDDDAPNGKIIIPYLDCSGKRVLYLRAHKMGPKGVDLEIYGQHVFCSGGSKVEEVVITEGEFKALALIQSGIPAIAIPGISTFGGKYIKKLVEFLGFHQVGKVVVLFDNEVKNDPQFPKAYKADPLKRWDTDYWACRMSRALYCPEEGITSSLIARLPDEWRIEGKIDPDGALASGKKPEDLRQVIKTATIPQKYLEQLPDEGQIVVKYKLAKDALTFSPLKEDFGRYKWESKVKEQDVVEVLSDFVFLPTKRIRRSDGTLERIHIAKNLLGEQTEIPLTPKALVSVNLFKETLLNAGNFHWTGKQHHLDELTQRLAVLASPKIIIEAQRFGRQDDDTWIFADGLVKDGKVFELGEDGVVWGPSLEGLIPLNDPHCPPPKIVSLKGDVPDICDVYESLAKNIGNPAVGLGIGWVLGCIWSNEIFAELGFFPILGMFAAYQSGKTTLGRWLTGGTGIPSHGQNPIKIETSTAKGMDRTLDKISSLPVWGDEFRNSLKPQLVNGLRSIFDRSGGVQAVKSNDLQTRGSNIRGCLVLSGEELPSDPALLSRIICIRLSEKDRDVDAYPAAREMMGKRFPLLFLECLKQKATLEQTVMKCIQTAHQLLAEVVDDERQAWLFAVPLGVFFALMKDPDEGSREEKIVDEVLGWAREESVRLFLEKHQDDHLARFWAGLNVLTTKMGQGGLTKVNRYHLGLSKDDRTLYVWMAGVYPEYYAMEKGKGGEPFSQRTLRSYFSECPYLEKLDSKRRFGGRYQPCRESLAFSLTHPETPKLVKDLYERIKNPFWDSVTPESELLANIDEGEDYDN